MCYCLIITALLSFILWLHNTNTAMKVMAPTMVK